LRESPYVLGKADVTYKNVVKHLPLYESCPADLAYYVLGKAGLLRNAPHIGSLVVIAVALLHYFRKTFRRGVITGGFKARCNAHIEAFKSWAPRTAEGVALKSIAASTIEVEQYNIYSAVLSSINDINNNEKLRSAAAAVLGLLNKADGAVAKRNRRISA